MAFKRTNIRVFGKNVGQTNTPDSIYWKKLGVPVLVKEYGTIDYIDFSPVEPHNFAVTCAVRVQIYNPITKLVTKNLSRFQENAYGGTFRRDGRLLVAGDEESYVKLFDVSTKNILRSFRGHKGPVHRTFFTSDMLHIASFSDDKTVKLWDIPSEKCVNTFGHHTDYVRAGSVSPVSPNIVLSGGYDGIIKMYDTRNDQTAFEVKHGSPIESLIFLPTGGVFISAGGTEIKVWDALMGGKLFASISQHHKTVTSLKLASNGRRLLSGSLDHHIKIYDVSSYQVVHNIDFPSAVLSVGVSANDTTLVAGMVDGLVSISRREDDEDTGNFETQEIRNVKEKYSSRLVDQIVEEHKKYVETKFDKFLRKYEYKKALDDVMKEQTITHAPHVTVALINELHRRKGFERAIVGRDQKFLFRLLRFLNRYIGDARFTTVLLDATEVLLDAYENKFDEFSSEIAQAFIKLAEKLEHEEEVTLECANVQGALELITAGASITASDILAERGLDKFKPTENAGQHSVITIK